MNDYILVTGRNVPAEKRGEQAIYGEEGGFIKNISKRRKASLHVTIWEYLIFLYEEDK